MNNELILLSNNEIPFPEAELSIHNPSLNEISLIGEECFFSACQILSISKDFLEEQDRIGLEELSNFDIFMTMIMSQEGAEYKQKVLLLFNILFPNYKIKFNEKDIIFIGEGNQLRRINNTNFEIFKEILNSMFNLNSPNDDGQYNPSDARAKKIAEKLKKHKEKVAQNNEKSGKIAILSRYASVLAIGLKIDLNTIMNYTVFKLMDSFQRFQLKQSFDIYLKAKMAGAKDLDDVDNWMEDIHP